ncbi:Kontroller Of Growth [Scheffersomyces stipitis CBS 6054]|uniref:Kontroller Of Growth n=1 Tax=Scheffersomyces stipitis (strain ATCC 58785 / CBS 6054 / NBRC 10063 / NRRL Y-11545) TaxID=322104 RepID=A3GFX3_PICST|nr:Kontroller Of Growth [Scheffersomyces stipitis CBS 6054]EAZ63418.2 Kontroller Of Growth [Scheffersomyces stipitis CBS 6054]
MRHGFDEDYSSENFLNLLANTFYIYFDDKRQNTNGNPITAEMKQSGKYYKNYQPITDWKVMKERQKTISAVLVLCLNLGVDPPDIMKTYPCAKLESWCDPSSFPDTKKAIENIGKNLQSQYETLSLRTRYKQSLDPCVEDVKRFCNTLRRNAKDERILFHYNGHGVPQPTASGEIWVFNRGYTQYIPISLYDLQTWLGAPVIFVYDCNSAGNIVHNFKKFVQKRIDDGNEGNHDTSAPSPTSAYLDCIQMAACKSNELLPMSPDLPADLFTCCLTCPIDISIKWFIMQSPLKKNYYSLLPKNSVGNVIIPGKLTDRRTPLGELNWIFTAITDTIAWTSLSRPIFKRLFRQDLMVAALFRNFLLAKRIMPHLNCNPISDPPLPDLVRFHPMWDSWDLAIDQVLAQLIKNHNLDPTTTIPVPSAANSHFASQPTANGTGAVTAGQNLTNYQHSTFFEQQLTAFEIWLKYAGPSTKEPPEQLPIVLQVLLSQVHRLRALILLSKFLDLGPWAVYLSLSIGIFPYVLKLLQSPAQELKPVLIFIWARIMAIDYKSTQQELCKDKGYNYFYLILNSNPMNPIGAPGAPGSFSGAAGNTSSILINDDHKAMSAFILTLFIKDFKNGQRLCFSIEIINNCLKFIQTSENPLLRQWCSLLLSQLWNKYHDGKWIIYKDGYLNKLLSLINDPIPEVRTSIIVAITNFLSVYSTDQPPVPQQNSSFDLKKDEVRQQDLKLANTILSLLGDGSSMVRKEIVFFINRFVTIYFKFFLVVAFNQLEEEIVLIDNSNYLNDFRKRSPAYGSIFSTIWKSLLILSEDPHLEVKQLAETLIDSVMVKLNESELGPLVKEMQDYLLNKSTINISDSFKPSKPIVNRQLGHNRQVSSASMVNRKSNMLTINGSSITTRSVSANNTNRNSMYDDSGSDTESLSSRLRNFSLNNLFKSFQMNEETDIKNFSRILNSGPVQTNYGNEYRPKTPLYRARDLSQVPELPAESGFFEYSCEYFQEPQMSKNEIDEPGSKEYVKRLWRRNRNESIIQETQPQKELAVRGDWNRNVKTLNNKSQPKFIKFTQFEKILVASDEKDNVSVWDWEENKIVKKFSNGNPFGTKITDMKFLNEDDLPLLLTGSSDGVIKIYKNFHNYEDESENEVNDTRIELVASWRALTDLLLTSKSSGLISEWQQSRGSLLVSGDVKIIRVWDAPRELCLVDIPARSSSSITSLTSDQVAGNIFIAGFDDGSLRVYDRRLDSRESMVKTWRGTRSANVNGSNSPIRTIGSGSIRNVHMQRGGFRELVSGSGDGYVNLWDIRLDEPVLTFNAAEKSMRCIDTHEHAPIITTGSKAVNLWTTSGDLISTLRNPQETYLTNRTSSYLSTTTFHPHRMTMATNYNQDGHINVYTCSDTVVEY